MSPAEEPIVEPQSESGPVILVAEDEVMIRLGISEHLRSAGYTVIEAVNGQEARAVLEAGVGVDLVFSDIDMPMLDGIGLAQWILLNQPHTPVMLTSGLAAALATAQTACPHVKAFVNKPYVYEAVADSMRAILARSARR
ncbi:response regulator [Terricaulis sp.]|uniref:response regulator n=1 Tax=Terricaulis sp. TaxID=2768686 RepID=UPI003784654E